MVLTGKTEHALWPSDDSHDDNHYDYDGHDDNGDDWSASSFCKNWEFDYFQILIWNWEWFQQAYHYTKAFIRQSGICNPTMKYYHNRKLDGWGKFSAFNEIFYLIINFKD